MQNAHPGLVAFIRGGDSPVAIYRPAFLNGSEGAFAGGFATEARAACRLAIIAARCGSTDGTAGRPLDGGDRADEVGDRDCGVC